ncbi:MAG: M48 family metallopeptidase [Pseudomonadota bacterium]
MRWLTAIVALAASAAQATPETDRAALLALQATDLRVASVAHRLSTANIAICPNQTPQLGFSLHALAQYGGTFRAAAKITFGLGDDPTILAIVPGSAAEVAGFAVGDALIGVGATRLGKPTASVKQSYDLVREAETALDNGPKTRPFKITIKRSGTEQAISINPKPGCVSRVVVEPGGKLNAYADGTYVKLTSGVAEYASDDGELAAIVAHEMAHNILAHQVLLDANGRSRANILETEIEADTFSVRLLAGAGYDPRVAARFWARFGKKTGAGIFATGTHLRTKARVALLEAAAKLSTNESQSAQ